LTPAELARADGDLTVQRVREALQALRERYEEDERAFQVYQLGDGYQLLTRPEYAPYLERFDSVPRPPTLSRAALETLAIIAYRQPIGRIEVEEIRGVAATSVLRTLQDWELIDIVGRGDGLGRPLLYGTTSLFLDHFGFRSLSELPRPEELPIALRRVEELDAAEGEAGDSGADPAASSNGAGPVAESGAHNGASRPETPGSATHGHD
jgi:segregation and condensation protein B